MIGGTVRVTLHNRSLNTRVKRTCFNWPRLWRGFLPKHWHFIKSWFVNLRRGGATLLVMMLTAEDKFTSVYSTWEMWRDMPKSTLSLRNIKIGQCLSDITHELYKLCQAAVTPITRWVTRRERKYYFARRSCCLWPNSCTADVSITASSSISSSLQFFPPIR